MRAVVATPDGASRTELREVEEPRPAPSETLIAVRAFSVNRGELRLIASRGEGWRPGQDVAGYVVSAAADGSGPPEGVDDATAVALPMAGTTAANLVRLGGSLLGKRVLVTGASGGVGHIAVQLAEIAGGRVTAVASADAAEADDDSGLPATPNVA